LDRVFTRTGTARTREDVVITENVRYPVKQHQSAQRATATKRSADIRGAAAGCAHFDGQSLFYLVLSATVGQSHMADESGSGGKCQK
jgi:hypothetical protein